MLIIKHQNLLSQMNRGPFCLQVLLRSIMFVVLKMQLSPLRASLETQISSNPEKDLIFCLSKGGEDPHPIIPLIIRHGAERKLQINYMARGAGERHGGVTWVAEQTVGLYAKNSAPRLHQVAAVRV